MAPRLRARMDEHKDTTTAAYYQAALVAEDGLPVGVQIIAKYGADARALAAARFGEQVLARQ